MWSHTEALQSTVFLSEELSLGSIPPLQNSAHQSQCQVMMFTLVVKSDELRKS